MSKLVIEVEEIKGRCFIHVDDLAWENVVALQPSAINQIFNLAGSEFVTINKMVEALRENVKNLKIPLDRTILKEL